MHIKAGDTVVIISGSDKITTDKKGKLTSKTGKVLKAFPDEQKVLVQGVNMIKKHNKPTQQDKKGGIAEYEAPVHVSNVMLLDPKTNQPTRVGYKIEDGKKVRYAKKSGTILDK